MANFSNKSKKELETCHKDIQIILKEAIKVYDFSVNEGIRSTERQQYLFRKGNSKLDGVTRKSKHQARNGVSYAVDILPYKKGYNPWDSSELNIRRFYFMMGIIRAISERLLAEGKITHKVRFGLDWDSDDIFSDQTFLDCPHLELV